MSQKILMFQPPVWAFYIIISTVRQNYFSDLYPAKILDLSAKPFFSVLSESKILKRVSRGIKLTEIRCDLIIRKLFCQVRHSPNGIRFKREIKILSIKWSNSEIAEEHSRNVLCPLSIKKYFCLQKRKKWNNFFDDVVSVPRPIFANVKNSSS